MLPLWFSVSVRTLQAPSVYTCIHQLLLLEYVLCDRQPSGSSELLNEYERQNACLQGAYHLLVAREVQAGNNYNIISLGEIINRALLETKASIIC